MKVFARLLVRWTAWVISRPRLILWLAIASAVACLFLAGEKLGVNTNQLSLISPHHPLIKLADKLDPFRFGGKDTFTVVVEAPTPDRAVAFVNALAPRIQQDKADFQDVFFRVNPDKFKQWALLYVDKDKLLEIKENLKDYANLIKGLSDDPDALTFLSLVNKEMATQMVGQLFTGFLDDQVKQDGGGQGEDPNNDKMDLSLLVETLQGLKSYLDGSPDYKSPWSSFFKNASWNLDLEGYFWEGGKRYLLMFVAPNEGKDGFGASQHCLDKLRQLIDQTKASFPDIHAGVTGQEALNTDEMTTALNDMARATWLSLLGVLILMCLFFRGVRRPLIEIIALAIGICWTFGWTTIVIGHLNILSIVFAPLLCGLGVDYGIHWFARFEEEERVQGSNPSSVIDRVTGRSGPAIFLAGLSTAVSFLPLVLTDFSGLEELGLITGAGILLIVLADFWVLPALSVRMAGRPPKCKTTSPNRPDNGDLLRFNRTHAVCILSAALILCAASTWSALRVRFDLNPMRLQDPTAQSVVWEKRLLEGSKRSLISAAAFASSPEEVKEKTKAFEKLPAVQEVESVFTLLPEQQSQKIPILRSILPSIPRIDNRALDNSPADARKFIDILERIRFKMQEKEAKKSGADQALVDQMAQVKRLAEEISAKLGATPDKFAKPLLAYRERFQEDLFNTWDFFRDAASTDRMNIQDIPRFLRDWFYHDGEFLIRIYPKESPWEQNTLSRFVQELQKVDPNVAGDPVSLYVFASAFKRACVLASVYALVGIFILLTITFRSLVMALLALLPLAVGTLWVVGVMGLAGVDFNLANSIFMPLIVGAGVEYGVIILHRWREGTMLPGHLPVSTGKGVILAALTTTVGFGTLMLSHHRGIFSLGFVAWVGSICVLIAAVILLPAVLAVASGGTKIESKED
jgi:hopanoid biosynthesis associated RND transporter like protein HpnN